MSSLGGSLPGAPAEKRARIEDDGKARDADADGFTSLPDGVLGHISDYLARESQALCAVAMTAPSPSFRARRWIAPRPWSARDAVLGVNGIPREMWESGLSEEGQRLAGVSDILSIGGATTYSEDDESFDFETEDEESFDFEAEDEENFNFGAFTESVGGKVLTDDDLGAVLVCIDAKNRLRSFKLTNCTHIVGYGLEPLRGSAVLEQIDVSCDGAAVLPSGHPRYIIADSIRLDDKVVIPILESIVEKDGNSLRHVQLPKKWRVPIPGDVSRFLTKFNNAISLSCCKLRCQNTCEELMNNSGDNYGLQSKTCYGCMELFRQLAKTKKVSIEQLW
ncbi:hypothetical protein ACHAWF_015303 [Thalassiosira exigua]